MKSDPSFEIAAKHLFRHLHEPHALRRNPLVAHFFKGCAVSGLARAHDERAVLRQIHDLVRSAARHYLEMDAAGAKRERALRHYAIITQQCLKRRPIREVAQALGISHYHCYRERASICRRVAQYIVEHKSVPGYLVELDEFDFLLSQARYRAGFSDADAAVRACQDLAQLAPSLEQKIEALRISVLISMEFGNLVLANKVHRSAHALFEEHELAATPSSRGLARASLALLDGEFAYRRGDSARALLMAERATTQLEPYQRTAPHAAGLYTESLFALGIVWWSLGKTDMGYDWALRAEASLRHTSATFLLRTRIEASLWKLRNYLLLNDKKWYPSWQRLEGLLTAFREAYRSGSLAYSVDNLVVLSEHHAFAGNDDEALKAGRLATRLAEQHPSGWVRLKTNLEIAVRLLPTRHWAYGASLIPTGQRLEDIDAASYRDLFLYYTAHRLLRLGRFQDAFSAATTPEADRVSTLAVRKKVVAAAAAHALERRRDARTLIEAALIAAEGLRSAPILRDANEVAAKITKEPHFRRKAREVAQLITA